MRAGRALVTGASSGIGAHIARRLSREGFDLVLVARRADLLEELARELSPTVNVEVIAADLTDPAAPARIADALGPVGVDVLVNNAGGGWIGAFAEAPLVRQLQIIDLNVRALVELTHRLLGPMKQHGRGHIVQIASVAGFMPGPLASVYYASKAFVVRHAEALDYELRGSGVKVCLSCPGPVATEFQRSSGVSGDVGASVAMSAEAVAEETIDAMLKGRFLVAPGASNRAVIALSNLLPNRLLMNVVSRIQRKRISSP
jgi:uncharacterized protein